MMYSYVNGATFVGEEIEEFADLSPGCLEVSRFCSPHQMFELCKDLLDRAKVGAVGRQEEQMRSFGTDRIAGQLALVAAEIGENDDLVLYQSARQHPVDIDGEELAIDGGIDDHDALMQ